MSKSAMGVNPNFPPEADLSPRVVQKGPVKALLHLAQMWNAQRWMLSSWDSTGVIVQQSMKIPGPRE